MDTPQEVEVWFVLPSIRRQYVKEFKELGYPQNKIAGIIGLTDAAVSQYLKGKRGQTFLDAETEKFISSSALFVSDKVDFRKEFQKAISVFRSSKGLCRLCNLKTGTAMGCDVCHG